MSDPRAARVDQLLHKAETLGLTLAEKLELQDLLIQRARLRAKRPAARQFCVPGLYGRA